MSIEQTPVLHKKKFNQFYKEASERKMRKIAESKLSPTNSADAVSYMKRKAEIASHI